VIFFLAHIFLQLCTCTYSEFSSLVSTRLKIYGLHLQRWFSFFGDLCPDRMDPKSTRNPTWIYHQAPWHCPLKASSLDKILERRSYDVARAHATAANVSPRNVVVQWRWCPRIVTVTVETVKRKEHACAMCELDSLHTAATCIYEQDPAGDEFQQAIDCLWSASLPAMIHSGDCVVHCADLSPGGPIDWITSVRGRSFQSVRCKSLSHYLLEHGKLAAGLNNKSNTHAFIKNAAKLKQIKESVEKEKKGTCAMCERWFSNDAHGTTNISFNSWPSDVVGPCYIADL